MTYCDPCVRTPGAGFRRTLETLSVTADTAGYLKLMAWAYSFGQLRRAGVEGTATYGAGLTHILRDHEVEVLEVNRPDRTARRSQGKSDPTDAEMESECNKT